MAVIRPVKIRSGLPGNLVVEVLVRVIEAQLVEADVLCVRVDVGGIRGVFYDGV